MTIKLVGSTNGSTSLDAPASTTGGADLSFTLPNATTGGIVRTTTTPGAILQVVSTAKTDAWSESVAASATSSVITGLTVQITPSSTSNKVLILCHISGTCSSSVWQNWSLTRGGARVDAATGDQHGSNRKRNTVGGLPYTNTEIMNNYFFNFLDSPSSTDVQTYGVVFTNGAGATNTTAYVNQGTSSDSASRGSYTSMITAMEVAG